MMKGEDKLKERVDSNLVHASKLEITIKVLLIERLEARVEQPTQQRALHLLYNLRTSLLRIVLRHDRRKSVIVHIELA